MEADPHLHEEFGYSFRKKKKRKKTKANIVTFIKFPLLPDISVLIFILVNIAFKVLMESLRNCHKVVNILHGREGNIEVPAVRVTHLGSHSVWVELRVTHRLSRHSCLPGQVAGERGHGPHPLEHSLRQSRNFFSILKTFLSKGWLKSPAENSPGAPERPSQPMVPTTQGWAVPG